MVNRQEKVTAAVNAELAIKGLTMTDSDSADLYIGYQTAIGTEKQFTSYNTGWGYGPGMGRGVVWRRWNVHQHDLWLDVDRLCRSTGPEHIRSRRKTDGMAGDCDQDIRPQSQARKEREEHWQGCKEVTEEFSTHPQELAHT